MISWNRGFWGVSGRFTGAQGSIYDDQATELWSICQSESSIGGIEKINGERGCKNRHSQIKTDKDLGYSGDSTEISSHIPPTVL